MKGSLFMTSTYRIIQIGAIRERQAMDDICSARKNGAGSLPTGLVHHPARQGEVK
jgi:hypothetical protein